MRDLLLLELLLAVLLVTSFTTVGLLALWTATSPRHWFVRTAAFLAAIATLLFVPAYEPFVTFAIQGAVVACGVQVYRWRRTRRSPTPSPTSAAAIQSAEFHFSLSTLLLLTAVVAVSTLIAVQLPLLNRAAWYSVVAIGLTSGLVTLAAAFMSSSRRRLIVLAIGLCLTAAAGFALSKVDWFAPSVIGGAGWPPTNPLTPNYNSIWVATPIAKFDLVWPLALSTTFILLGAILVVAVVAFESKRRFPQIVAAITIALVAAFPLFILWQLLTRPPIPSAQLPTPNAYDDLVAAGNTIRFGSPILSTSIQPNSTTQLAAEVAKFATNFAQVRAALSRSSAVPVWRNDELGLGADSFAKNLQAIRGVAWALDCEENLAYDEGRFRDAAMISIDNMRAGEVASRGGITMHYLVSLAAKGIGEADLYRSISHLDANTCHEAIEAIEQLERNREPLDVILRRDRIHEVNSRGWYGFQVLLRDVANADRESDSAMRQMASRSKTISHLLIVELALRQYHLKNGVYPDRLEYLVPKYLAAVSDDPYAASDNPLPLRYKTTPNGYLLYSVGVDGDDDGGGPTTRESGWFGDGDLRLDAYMVPDKTSGANVDADAEPDAPEPPNAPDSN